VTRDQVLAILRAHQKELKDRFGIEKLALFGSFARDEADESSDVDLTIMQMRKPSMWTIAEAMEYLRTILHRKVDLGTWKGIRAYYKRRIKSELIDVY
jgi:predicted nucleotidyltransferase